LTGTTQTSATYSGTSGHTYGFYSIATDNVGNVQPIPTAAQATTTVVSPLARQVEEAEPEDQVDRHQHQPLEPGRLPIDDQLSGQNHSQDDGDDLEPVEEQVHVLSQRIAAEDQHGCDDQGNLDTGPHRDPQGEVHLVRAGETDRVEELGGVADQGQ